MKILLTLVLLSSVALATTKDPRVDIAKRETAKLYRGHVYRTAGTDVLEYGIKSVNLLEQKDNFFLTQITAKNKKNFCFILEVDIINNATEISVTAQSNENENAFIQACSEHPTADELTQFKLLNAWPVK